jgi:outer membrane protein assembly factor BamB
LTLDGDLVTQVRDLNTGRVVDLGRSYLAWVGTDDGTVPDTLLVQADERLDALDLTTGMQRWRATSPPRSTLALVVADGTVARLADDGLTVLDAATGSPLWQLSTLPYGLSLVTDGRHLLVLESVPDAGRVVASYDLRDGRREWEAPIPIAVQRLAVVDHRLFGAGSGGLVAFTSEG